jgi:hypothetical protein
LVLGRGIVSNGCVFDGGILTKGRFASNSFIFCYLPAAIFLLLLVRHGVNFPFITDEFSVTSHMKVDTSSLLHRGAFPEKALHFETVVCYFLLCLILPSSFNWERHVLTGA